MAKRQYGWIYLSIVGILAALVVAELWSNRGAEDESTSVRLSGTRPHGTLQYSVDVPGVAEPNLVDVDSVDLPDSTDIVGIKVGGDWVAFVLDAMVDDPRLHIVNLTTDQKRVSMTYCDLSDCVRVLESDVGSPKELRVGGLDTNNRMVLMFDGKRYSQTSELLPLEDHPYSRMKLGQWILQHPDTRIYIGPVNQPSEPLEITPVRPTN